MKHILIILIFISGQMMAQDHSFVHSVYKGESVAFSTFPNKHAIPYEGDYVVSRILKSPMQDTLIVRLGNVTRDKTTLVTETEIKGEVETIKRERYNKARAEQRIDELSRQIESDNLMMEQYITMLDQIRQEIQNTRKRVRQNERIRKRLENVLNEL